MRVTRAQIDAAAARMRAERAALEASMSAEQLAQHDAREAAEPDIFAILEAERAVEVRVSDLDQAEQMTLDSLGATGIRYLKSLTEADYAPFNIDDFEAMIPEAK